MRGYVVDEPNDECREQFRLDPHLRLWFGIFIVALKDSCNRATRGKNSRIAREAREWLKCCGYDHLTEMSPWVNIGDVAGYAEWFSRLRWYWNQVDRGEMRPWNILDAIGVSRQFFT